MTPPRRGARPDRQVARRSQRTREEPPALEAAQVTIDIEDLSSFSESINIQIIGPSGHGKTVLAGGAPNAVFLSTEKGVVSAKIAGSRAQLLRAPRWEECLAGMRWADEHLGGDDWLIADSHTKMQVLYLRWILRMVHESNESRDLDIPAIQDHQKFQNGFKRFTDHLIDAPYNTIFINTPMIKEDEDGEDMVMADIQGKNYAISSYCSAQMDVILYYAISKRASTSEQTVRRALAQPYPPYIAKDRFDALGKFWDVGEGDYFAMADMIEAIQEAIKNAS